MKVVLEEMTLEASCLLAYLKKKIKIESYLVSLNNTLHKWYWGRHQRPFSTDTSQ